MTPDNKEKLLEKWHSSTLTLRKKAAFFLGLLIIVIGLLWNQKQNLNKHAILQNKWQEYYYLSQYDGDSLKELIERSRNDDDTLVLNYINFELYFKLQKSNFSNSEIFNEIQKIDMEKQELFFDQSFNILGVQIPLKIIILLSVIILTILFHEFTQTLHYKRTILNELHKFKFEKWELGHQMFGQYSGIQESTSGNYINFISGLITFVVLICPLTTSLLLFDFLGGFRENDYVILLNIPCLLIISINTTIVFYKENILGVGYLVDLFMGNIKDEPKLTVIFFIWIMLPMILVALHSLNWDKFNLPLKECILVTTQQGLIYQSL
ncbi:hypothetical protein RCC89_13415 [Cytophagaceae bacterium ABcell3]|nr:hypothetical protein RCC89_13415 [Cytophagaceae bacterium ABcell3]